MSNETHIEKPVMKKKKNPYAKQSYTATLLLSFFLGGVGAHRFYTGYTALGLVQLFTLGGCGIWSLIDFISICFNNFKTEKGLLLREYNKTLGLTFFFIWVALVILSTITNVVTGAEMFSAMKGMQ